KARYDLLKEKPMPICMNKCGPLKVRRNCSIYGFQKRESSSMGIIPMRWHDYTERCIPTQAASSSSMRNRVVNSKHSPHHFTSLGQLTVPYTDKNPSSR